MYNKIINPITGRKVNTNSKLGKSIIKNYLNTFHSAGNPKSINRTLSSERRQAENEEQQASMTPLPDDEDNVPWYSARVGLPRRDIINIQGPIYACKLELNFTFHGKHFKK